MSILIKNILLNNGITDVLIEENIIKKISQNIDYQADTIIDGTNKALSAGFVNCHTHSAMTLFRGFGDDMELEEWLQTKIWPYEAHLTDEIVYHAAKLACLEMIKTGTTCFNDMYWNIQAVKQAVMDTGIRAVLSKVILNAGNDANVEDVKREVKKSYVTFETNPSDTAVFALGPHAVYTVNKETLLWVKQFAKDNNLLIHIHLAETPTECDNCVKQYGMTPVRFLNSLGLLSENLVIAHCLWVDDDEINMLADNGVKVVHNPNSNLKLASGYRFKYHEMNDKGIIIGLGTDGCSSSNNLDMTGAMKTASLIGKAWRDDPTATPARDMYKCATENGGKILRMNIGKIEEGYLADVILFDLNTPAFTPNYNFISNLVYAANGNDVDTVICNGKIVMQNKKVDNEAEILENGRNFAYKLMYNAEKIK